MADITLKTKLLNKFSETEVASLGRGEINFYPATTVTGESVAVMQVGGADGTVKTFAAPASDVYNWAKAASKPTYNATEIEGLEGFIAGEIQDTNTEYTFTVENGQLVIRYKDISEAEWKILTTIDIVTPDELNTVLVDYVTNSALTTALADYLTKDDFDTFKVENTSAIADAKAAGTTATSALNEYKTANDAAVAAVKATADAAAVKTEVETALAGKVEAVEGKSLVDDIEIARLATLVNYDDTAIKADIKANADAIDVIEADYLKAEDKTELANAINAEAETARAAEAKALEDAKAYADSIKSDLLGDDLADTFNTLKDVQDWVNTHGVEATELSTALAAETKAREEADIALGERISVYENAKDLYALKTETEAAIATAAADATAKANAAQAAAESTAAADATTKADAALEAAKVYADSLNHEDNDTTYTAGAGLKLDGTVFSIDTDLVFILDANA